jgi:osmotically-inducible protein OsmY
MSRWTCFGFTFVLLVWSGCGGEGYKATMHSAEANLSSLTMADYRHQLRLQEALVANPGFAGLTLSAYVFMERGYVIGHVDNPDQAEAVFQAARKVQGLRSLDAFLPVKRVSPHDTIGKVTSDEALKAQVESALAAAPGVVYSRVHVEVLDDRAVLLGVVSGSEEKVRAERAAAGTIGVKRIINWLLLPDTEYLAIRSQVF